MKQVTELLAKKISLKCPNCHEELDGFMADPRGSTFDCEYCLEDFFVDDQADIEMQ
jgi:hypothetical protein